MNTLGATVFICASALLPFNVVADKVDETRPVAADASISVHNVAGEINVTTWDKNEIHLTGMLGTNLELEITETTQGIQIEVRHEKQSGHFDESELHLVIPRGASIVAEAISADISILGSEGKSLSAESVSGDVTVKANPGRVDISSVSGDVDFEGSSSRTVAESVSGDIDLAGISGEVTVSTVSGDTYLLAGTVSLGRFDSVSGSLELNLTAEDGGRLTVESMSGDVTIVLPKSQTGEFNVQSFSGDISTDFGQVTQESHGPGSHLKHVSGNSGTTIRVDSFSGDIHIGHK